EVLRALHPKWRVKATAIEESKDLTSLSLDELIEILKVHEMIIKKDSETVKAKGERKSLALKAKKESNDEESSTSRSKDEEYTMAVRDFKKFFKRKGRDPNHLIGECPKPPKETNQRAFVGGSWSDSGEEDDEKDKDETRIMAQASGEHSLLVNSINVSIHSWSTTLILILIWSLINSGNSSAGATHQLSSGNISSLAVAKYTSSGNSFALTVAK
nr:UBN2 domain-containing protein [Tanacetum cinerariifolium]